MYGNYSTYLTVFNDMDGYSSYLNSKEQYGNSGTDPGAGSGCSCPSGGSGAGLTEEEKEKFEAFGTELDSHISDYLRLKEDAEREIGLLQQKLEALRQQTAELEGAFEATSPTVINQVVNATKEYQTATTIVKETVSNTLDAADGKGTSVSVNSDGKVSLDVNVSSDSGLNFVEKEVTNEQTGEIETRSELALGWASYDDTTRNS